MHRPSGPGTRLETDQCRSSDGAGCSVIAFRLETAPAMQPLLKEIRHTPLLWMLVFVPAVLVAETVAPHSYTLLFVLAVLAIVPLATPPEPRDRGGRGQDRAMPSGGLLNATLGNLTELIIAITALRAGQLYAREGIDRRRNRHQRVVHAWRLPAARRAALSRPGIQPRRRTA